MKNTKKVLLGGVAALALVGTSVFGTYMYLTSKTELVNNTFTVGNVKITLDESDVNEYGQQLYDTGKVDEQQNPILVTDPQDVEGNKYNEAKRVTENMYKLIPGHEYKKDPTVHVAAGSEAAWLFVKVEDEIADIEDATKIADQMSAQGFTIVSGETNVYAYRDIVNAEDNIVVFENFKVLGTAKVDEYKTKSITVKAYAVQADGFSTAADAWRAASLDAEGWK